MEHIGLAFMGYNRQQVTALIDKKDQHIQQIEKELAQLREQVSQLESQLNHYVALEDELKAGIIDARVAGKKIVEQSTKEATDLVEKTNEQVAQYKEDLAYQSRELVNSGISLKDRFNEMKQEMATVLQAYQTLLDTTDFEEIYPDEATARLMQHLEGFEQEETLTLHVNDTARRAVSLNMEEQHELHTLIQDVVGSDVVAIETVVTEEDSAEHEHKLVQFKQKHEI